MLQKCAVTGILPAMHASQGSEETLANVKIEDEIQVSQGEDL